MMPAMRKAQAGLDAERMPVCGIREERQEL